MSAVGQARLAAVALAVPLVYLAAAQLARSVQVILVPWEQMYGESIIYDQAARIIRGEPLYQMFDRPPFSVAAYTPLYYVLGAFLQWVVGPGLAPGRWLSLAAGLGAATMVGYLAARIAGDRWAGVFAALLFLALGTPGVYPLSDPPPPFPPSFHIAYPAWPWSALYKEDTLATAFSLGAMVALVRGGRRAHLLGAILAALAFLTKQTIIAPALAGFVWLLLHDRRHAFAFGAVAGVLIGVVSIGLELSTHAFFANAVGANINPFREEALRLNLNMLFLFQVGPLVLTLLYGASLALGPRTVHEELVSLYWLATLPSMVGLSKVGSNHNHWMELGAATAVLAALGLWLPLRRAADWASVGAALAVLVLGVQLYLLVAMANTSPLRRPASILPNAAGVANFQRLVEQVRNEPGLVLANPLDVVVLAGRPILLEPYLFSIFSAQGRWEPAPLIEQVCAGEIKLVVLEIALEWGNPAFHGFEHWPPPLFDAMRETMGRQGELGGRVLYTPRVTAGAGPACAGYARAPRSQRALLDPGRG